MFWYFNRSLLQGKTVLRAYLDYIVEKETFDGSTLNLGAGGKDYYQHLHYNGSYRTFDNKTEKPVDFETEILPYEDNEFDNLMLFNVLEHIYNHKHLLKEVHRISSRFYGFVPFLMWYHADPNDYFRYTDQALEKLLKEVGYKNIKIKTLAIGPFTTGFHMVYSSFPKILRPFIFSPAYMLDKIFNALGRDSKRYALGYYFICEK